MRRLIAITGGIGSGKSVVCRIVESLGYPVYDCDSHAKHIMDNSAEIKQRIAREISPEAITSDYEIDRKRLSKIVFADKAKLDLLNAIVHEAVRQDLKNWVMNLPVSEAPHDICFVETAILYESNLDKMVDAVWEVYAPADLRISRVCRRNNLEPDQVKARIDSQKLAEGTYMPHPEIYKIINDNCNSLLLQINSLLDSYV